MREDRLALRLNFHQADEPYTIDDLPAGLVLLGIDVYRRLQVLYHHAVLQPRVEQLSGASIPVVAGIVGWGYFVQLDPHKIIRTCAVEPILHLLRDDIVGRGDDGCQVLYLLGIIYNCLERPYLRLDYPLLSLLSPM